MERLKWNISPEEYHGKESVTHKSIWWLYTNKQHPIKDKNGYEYKISQFADNNFALWIGIFSPTNKIIFDKSFSSLKLAQKYGELLYLTSNK